MRPGIVQETGSDRELRARVCKALGHPTRLLLIERLVAGPLCVGELTAAAGADVSTVSRHLALLREARVLAAERRGAKVFYRLRVPCVLEFLSCVETALREEDHQAPVCRP